MGDLITLRDADLALIRRTVAKECNAAEFDQFIHIARAIGLDPLRRQLYAFIFGKGSNRDEDRKLTVVTGIDGYRTVSERTGNYRPDEEEPEYTYDETKVGTTNPLGIVKAKVCLWKYSHGDWFKVPGVVYWDEFVPLVYRDEDVEWVNTGKTYRDSGNPIYKKVIKEGAQQIIDPTKTGWVKMPRHKLALCAEAQAHRKGWPNDFAGVYVQEEIDRAHTIDLTASEIVETAEKKERLERIGGPALIVDWMDGNELQRVPYGQFYDKAMAYLRTCEGQPGAAAAWRDRNRLVINEFWSHDKAASLDLKEKIEALISAPTAPVMIDEPAEPALILPPAKPEKPKAGGGGRRRMARVPDDAQRLL